MIILWVSILRTVRLLMLKRAVLTATILLLGRRRRGLRQIELVSYGLRQSTALLKAAKARLSLVQRRALIILLSIIMAVELTHRELNITSIDCVSWKRVEKIWDGQAIQGQLSSFKISYEYVAWKTIAMLNEFITFLLGNLNESLYLKLWFLKFREKLRWKCI